MSKRILFIDDEPAFVRPHAETLSDNGYYIAKAESSAEAKHRLEENEFDLIILDLILPPDDYDPTTEPSSEIGINLLEYIRKDLPLHDIPIVIFTVVRDAGTNKEIKQIERKYNGESLILVKPGLPSQLLREIEKLISR